MAFFLVQPSSTTGVEIAAASSGNKARFLALGFSNTGNAQITLRIYDGTALAGTLRFEIAIAPGGGDYISPIAMQPGKSILPKTWFTAGNSIECALSGSGTVTVFGEVVREA